MRRWFLSYHSADQALAERLKAAIEHRDSTSRMFFAPTHLRAGRSWSGQLADEIAQADAFILLIGEKGIGDWQELEYDEALDRWITSRNKSPDFPLIVVLLEGQTAPGLQFLRRMHWITPNPASEKDVGRIFDAVALYDMLGNVSEWVEDCSGKKYDRAPTDGSATTADCEGHTARGGSWRTKPRDLRSADRIAYTSGFHIDYLGFRVARTLAP